MNTFKVHRSASAPRNVDVSGTLPSGHAFTFFVSPWSGYRCTDEPNIRAGFDVELHPDFSPGTDNDKIYEAIAQTNAIVNAMDERLGPLVETVVERSGIDEAAVRRVVRLGLAIALGREVSAAEVETAFEADAAAFEGRREAHLRPIAQANWEDAQEYEQGMRF